MEEIKIQIQRAEKISSFYETYIKTNLDKHTLDITEKFKIILDKYCDKYELVLNNSVYDKVNLFEFTSRVKKAESLKEKLIRKGQVFEYDNFFDENNLLINNVDELFKDKDLNIIYKNELCRYILNVDDLVGIKILTSLKNDCKNVFNLIKDNISEIEDIKLDLDGKIPDVMANGREIYKIKGMYKEIIKFELQIKSKIDSAWGDLEHNLFYKDYDFNYIKNTNKDVMVNIGALLEQIENLMLSVRNNKENFNTHYSELSFKNNLSKAYSDVVLDIFKSKYILEDNLELLYYLYIKNFGEYNTNSTLYDKAFVSYSLEGLTEIKIIENYQQLKNNNFIIPLVEFIYINWNRINGNNKDNNIIIRDLIGSIINFRMIEYEKLTGKELIYDNFISEIIEILEKDKLKFKEKNILIDKSELFAYIEICNIINEVKTEVEEGEISEFLELDEYNLDDFIKGVKLRIFNEIFDGSKQNLYIDDDNKIFLSKVIVKLAKYDNTNQKYKEILNVCRCILERNREVI